MTTSDPAAPYALPGAALPKYNPNPVLPIVNRIEVRAPPTHASRHCNSTVRQELKISANRLVITTNDTMKDNTSATPVESAWGRCPPIHFPIADNTVLTASEAIIRNTTPRIIPNDSTRFVKNALIPPWDGSGWTCHDLFNASWSAAKAPGPKIRVIMPIAVPMIPPD